MTLARLIFCRIQPIDLRLAVTSYKASGVADDSSKGIAWAEAEKVRLSPSQGDSRSPLRRAFLLVAVRMRPPRNNIRL